MSVVQLQTENRNGTEEEGCCFPCSPFLRELWRRVQMEIVVELPMLKSRWKPILFGAFFQYIHGIFTQLEHRLHQPQEVPLGDLGFDLLPELDNSKTWVSETVFFLMFASFLIWTFSPFVVARKRFYTAVLFSRLLMVLVVCQALRIVSFLSTQLPAPHYHCRKGEPTAVRPAADHWWEHILMNPTRQATGGCGDLVFSSHTTFILVGVLTYQTYGGLFAVKVLGWILAGILSLLIIASRKHYTVDIVVAWYTVPLVFYTMHRRWTTHRDMRDEDSTKGEMDTELEVVVQYDSRTQKSDVHVWQTNIYDNRRERAENSVSVQSNGLLSQESQSPFAAALLKNERSDLRKPDVRKTEPTAFRSFSEGSCPSLTGGIDG
ncbi:hypothetical protein BSKO_10720 [Bryopsis sp. KO-2023]|nr:hypothetical protein BSKO_10720 [Bryopsis sp. KO-2023]